MPSKLSQFCDAMMEAAWLAAVILIPLFFNVYSSRIFEPDKIAILRTLALLILAAWMVKLIDQGGLNWGTGQTRNLSLGELLTVPLILPMTLLALAYVIATVFSVVPRVSLLGSYQRLQGTYTTLSYMVIFAAMAANLRRRVQVERILTVVVMTSLPIALYGILQRYKIDPIPWGGDVSTRIASTMGNSIFVAAYLIMVIPLTIARLIQTFEAILKENSRLASQVARGSVYVFILALQLIALYMSGSRGPALGIIFGAFLLFILLSFYWYKRQLIFVIVAATLLVGGFLVALNIPGGPLESIRQSPAIGRFGMLLDTEQNSARVRQYIWEGALKLVTPHQPLNYPDGSVDKFNFLRPLIGYGPESMYVAYNPFYVPKLGTVEKRNASPDRSHNETWDSLVITGVLGLFAYLFMFGSVFYFAFKWLGLVRSSRQRNLFLALLAVGGLVGSVGMVILRGGEYLGVGLPFGIAAGVLLYLAYALLFEWPEKKDILQNDPARTLTLTVLLAAVLAHFIEINFGIAIVATRTLFWTYSGLLLVVGYILPRLGEYRIVDAGGSQNEPVQPLRASARAEARSTSGGKASAKAKVRRRTEPSAGGLPAWMQSSLRSAGLIAIVLVTLGYNFVSNAGRSSSAMDVISTSFAHLPGQNGSSYGILGLIVLSWLAMAVVYTAEADRLENLGAWLRAFGVTLVISLGLALIYWLVQAGSLSSLASFTPTNETEVIDQVRQIEGLITVFYFYQFLVLLVMAVFALREPLVKAAPSRSFGWAALAGGGLLVAILSFSLNLRIIHADISYKMADPFTTGNQWPVATLLYKRALDMAPNEDFYYLFLGRSYLEQAKNVTDDAALASLVSQAESDLIKAQGINPLNTDHTANLARLYSWWASRSTDAKVRQQRAQTALDDYNRALVLSPNNSTLWGEKAILYEDILNQPQMAFQTLSHALELDPDYEWTQNLMGNYYLRQSQAITNTQQVTELLKKAAEHFDASAKADSTYTDYSVRAGSALSLGDIDRRLGNPTGAISAYYVALVFNQDSTNTWKIQATLGQLYAQTGDKTNAMKYYNDAFQSAPADQKTQIQSLIAQLQTP